MTIPERLLWTGWNAIFIRIVWPSELNPAKTVPTEAVRSLESRYSSVETTVRQTEYAVAAQLTALAGKSGLFLTARYFNYYLSQFTDSNFSAEAPTSLPSHHGFLAIPDKDGEERYYPRLWKCIKNKELLLTVRETLLLYRMKTKRNLL